MRIQFRKLAGLAVSACTFISIVQAQADAAASTDIDAGSEQALIAQVVKHYSDHRVFQGVVLVARGAEELYVGATGMANREWGTPNGPLVKYRIASLTKGFTAALILKLVEEGKLSLSDTIRTHLPDYNGAKADVITVEQLLRHTSGMQHTVGLPGWFTGAFRRDISNKDYIQEIAKLPLLSEPGERYSYSNLDYFLLGKIAERVTGQSYADAINTRIFAPLGMQNSGVDTAAALVEKRADGYVWAHGGGFRNQGYNNMDVFGAGAALYSTAHDMLLWQQGLMGGKILSAKSMALMFEKDNAIGWRVQDWELPSGKQINTINYDGQIDGFSTFLTHFSASDVTVILLGNIGTGAPAKSRMAIDIKQALEGKALGKLPLSYHLTKALTDGRLAQGIERYLTAPGEFSIDEGRLESFGNEVGWAQMSRRSVLVRELTVKLFPRSVRALVRLAETQAGAGDRDAAAETYGVALAKVNVADEPDLHAYLTKKVASVGN